MTTRVWTGGGSNRATNANDWSSPGIPRPGDTLWMGGGTMNISGRGLAGNTLNVEASWQPGFIAPELPVSPPDYPTINLSHGADISINAYVMTQVTINAIGTNTLHLYESGFRPSMGAHQVTVNLAPHAVLKGGFTLQGAGVTNLTIQGGPGAAFVNDQSTLLSLGNARIDADVLGIGRFDLHFHDNLAFGGAVAAGQTVIGHGGTLRIDDPAVFHGLVDWVDPGQITLGGLVDATSYDFRDDRLAIYSGDTVIDTLRIRPGEGMALQVSRSATGVDVIGGLAGSLPAVPIGSALLPLHA